MKEEFLKELLDRYYDGQTSLEEEQMLKQYFSGNDLLPGYEADRDIFRVWNTQSVPSPAPDLESRIVTAVDSMGEGKAGFRFRIGRITYSGIAAGLLLLIAAYFLLKQRSEPSDTFSDPRIAYVETMRVLSQVSERLNTGTASLKDVGKIETKARSAFASIDKSATVLKGSLKPIEMVKRLDNMNIKKEE